MGWDRYERGERREGPWASREHRHEGQERRYREEDQRYRGGGGGERGFFDRARDEVASWFGDDEAERRRERDERMGGRDRGSQGEERWSSGRHDYDRGRETGRGYEEDERSGRLEGGRSYGGDRGSGGWLRGQSGQERGERDYRPMTGDYGRGTEDRRDYGHDSHWERDPYRRTSFAGSAATSNRNDPHYEEWRRRQVEELDRDYDEYRRERQSHFEKDFGGWRERRQSKRQLLGSVREHMEVVGSDDQHIGTVDRVVGDRIILTRSDPESGGAHHSLSCTDVDRVEGDRVVLDLSADQARQRWRDEGRGRALFEREDQGEAGPHILDRSFSGTYR